MFVADEHVKPVRDLARKDFETKNGIQVNFVALGYAAPFTKLLTAIARFDLRPRLGRIACPVLLISGGQDDTVPRGASVQLARGIARSQWVVLPDAKHAAPIDSADASNAYLRESLAANPGADSSAIRPIAAAVLEPAKPRTDSRS